MQTIISSWGSTMPYEHQVEPLYWLDQPLSSSFHSNKTLLAYGLGRSYGDCCLNENGILLATSSLNRLMGFDKTTGIVRVQAGMSLASLLEVITPFGWFLPVSPGTKYVTIGGAIANDVHGKNHHQKGTFGRYVHRIALVRSLNTSESGYQLLECSESENTELFKATIGGIGLTGLILWADVQLVKQPAYFDTETIRFNCVDDFFKLDEDSADKYEYTVAWVDCTSKGEHLGRGLYMRGNHTQDPNFIARTPPLSSPKLSIPVPFPNWSLNNLTVRAFNWLYFNKQQNDTIHKTVHYNPFFYPLDMVNRWNYIYGKRGFYQYQFVVPNTERQTVIRIFETIAESGLASFLAVLKRFGNEPSPGMLSFPKEGITLALDFPNVATKIPSLFSKLDEMVQKANGRLYPAKDSFMTPAAYAQYYPEFKSFKQYIDPKFSSSFLRRVNL